MQMHPSQKKLIEFLKNIDDLDGLSYWEIARETGLRNAQNVIHHLLQLEKRGYVRRDPSDPKKFEILKDPIEDAVYLNLYGFAQCGNKSEFFSELNLKEKVAISSRIFGISDPKECFLIKAKGDSMSPDIEESDLIVFDKATNANSGDIALVLDEGNCKIKQIRKTAGSLILMSSNQKYRNKIVKNKKEFQILGVARNIIHHL